jgi:hypothetical protein
MIAAMRLQERLTSSRSQESVARVVDDWVRRGRRPEAA